MTRNLDRISRWRTKNQEQQRDGSVTTFHSSRTFIKLTDNCWLIHFPTCIPLAYIRLKTRSGKVYSCKIKATICWNWIMQSIYGHTNLHLSLEDRLYFNLFVHFKLVLSCLYFCVVVNRYVVLFIYLLIVKKSIYFLLWDRLYFSWFKSLLNCNLMQLLPSSRLISTDVSLFVQFQFVLSY